MLLLYALSLAATLAAAVTDARTGRIPNWLSLPLIAVGPVVHLAGHGSTAGLGSLLGIVACAALPLLLFVKGAMGGGDVKLLAALGGLLGTHVGIEIQLASYLLLTMFVLASMAWHGQLWRTLRNALMAGANLVLPRKFHRTLDPATLTQVRMGGAIFAATALCVGRLTLGR
jgi:prepilin peptidase CpaA